MSVATRPIAGWERWQILGDYQQILRDRVRDDEPDGWCKECGRRIEGRTALAKFCSAACKKRYWRPGISGRGKRVAA